MKLGVRIERLNYYRVLAPVIDAALEAGWRVTCWHDYKQRRLGSKGSEFPHMHSVPLFRHGRPEVRVYHGVQKPWEWQEAMLGITLPADADNRWVTLQYAGELGYCLLPAVRQIGVYTRWWRDFGLEDISQEAQKAIRAKTTAVGFPELDAIALIDPDEVRRRWRLEPGRPVVTLLPYPFRSNGQATGAGIQDEALCLAIRAFADANDALLLVKARAKDPVPRYLGTISDCVVYDEQQYPPTILEALAISDFCVHFYSAAALEAAACGIPALSICPSLEEMGARLPWQARLFRRGGGMFDWRGVNFTMSPAEALDSLPRLRLGDLAIEAGARAAYADQYLGPLDGQSSRRLLSIIS